MNTLRQPWKAVYTFLYRVAFDIGNEELLKPWSERIVSNTRIVLHMRMDSMEIIAFNSYSASRWGTEIVKHLLNPMKVGNENILHIEIQKDIIKVFNIEILSV